MVPLDGVIGVTGTVDPTGMGVPTGYAGGVDFPEQQPLYHWNASAWLVPKARTPRMPQAGKRRVSCRNLARIRSGMVAPIGCVIQCSR